MSQNLHTVTVTIDDPGYDARVEFHCAGDETAPCHQYPDCDCESWDDDHEHPKVPHEKCWMFDWFDNDAIDYQGDDGDDDGTPTIARSGPINAWFADYYVAWKWAT